MVRVKKRYLLIEILPHTNQKFEISSTMLMREIRNKVNKTHGDFGIGSINAGFLVKKFNSITNVALLMCNRSQHYILLTTLPFITSIDGKLCSIRLLKVSGTIRSSCKYLIKFYNLKNDEAQQIIGRGNLNLAATINADPTIDESVES